MLFFSSINPCLVGVVVGLVAFVVSLGVKSLNTPIEEVPLMHLLLLCTLLGVVTSCTMIVVNTQVEEHSLELPDKPAKSAYTITSISVHEKEVDLCDDEEISPKYLNWDIQDVSISKQEKISLKVSILCKRFDFFEN